MPALATAAGALIALFLATGCSNPELDGCTLEACRSLLEECRFTYVVDLAVCLQQPQDQKGEFEEDDLLDYCVQACRHRRAGELLSCMEENAELCTDGDEWKVEEMCQLPSVERDPDCVEACQEQRRECERVCPRTPLLACGDCELECRNASYDCVQTC